MQIDYSKSKWSLKKPLYLDKKDKRYPKHVKQLKENGFSDAETWSLYSPIAEFILPRLIRFKEIAMGYPMGLSEAKWNEILDDMIFALDWSLTSDEKSETMTKGEVRKSWQRYERGMKLFAKWFRDLWW